MRRSLDMSEEVTIVIVLFLYELGLSGVAWVFLQDLHSCVCVYGLGCKGYLQGIDNWVLRVQGS